MNTEEDEILTPVESPDDLPDDQIFPCDSDML
eukprot:CAMPEP_0185572676 /NCGR_PEP_ID=MMETSP0434-20130131/4563_1 /TAXON_ID=626734 ORGANISM="Favella taraikaensis, Strain Fe Narragansett Bay" /NCGR_SAMPLE_ID=MMETSP0434 /ASSEMBLY_ACC=CAM_ASM_000379 /LENGTH=31 /DNA_ID= /DNA_START= /DNA_END= /DNA_ORIENTATION=